MSVYSRDDLLRALKAAGLEFEQPVNARESVRVPVGVDGESVRVTIYPYADWPYHLSYLRVTHDSPPGELAESIGRLRDHRDVVLLIKARIDRVREDA